ncbi:MAG: prenyltransferase, partial [Chloroflexi bacterium]
TWADREADAIAGKYTLATRWPPRRLRGLYLLVALLAFGLVVLLAGKVLPPTVALLSVVAVPLVGWGWLVYTRRFTPAPSNAMVVFLLAQMLGWYINGIAI